MPSPRDTSPQLTVRALHKRFDRTTVLDGVDLDVFPGEVVLITGNNGSGKTTLLRCIAGLARYEGTVTLDGQPCGTSPATRAALGYLPQAIGLPAWASVADVLELFGRLRGASAPTVALPDGFLPPLEQAVGELSGGQRQRVAIAVALLGDPRLLLLDEPAANLDAHGRAALVEVVAAVRERGASVLIAAPSPGDLDGLPDRTVHLEDGRVVGAPTLRLAAHELGGDGEVSDPDDGDGEVERSEVAP